MAVVLQLWAVSHSVHSELDYFKASMCVLFIISSLLPIQCWHNLLLSTKIDGLGTAVFSIIYLLTGKESVSQLIRAFKGAISRECRANKFH